MTPLFASWWSVREARHAPCKRAQKARYGSHALFALFAANEEDGPRAIASF